MREDDSNNGDAWNSFTHDQARSRADHWGEDGLVGLCDDHQILCFALALWNGNDSILKEDDFYLDRSPTHSYLKALYQYPQAAVSYEDLVVTNRRRGRDEPA